jgi:phosphate transport system substrate-binding protein
MSSCRALISAGWSIQMIQRLKLAGSSLGLIALLGVSTQLWSQMDSDHADVTPPLPHYVAHKQEVPKSAEYVLPDGSIYIAGNDLVAPLLDRIDAIFAAKHPGFKFKTDLISSGVAVAGVSSGKSAFGPTGRDVTPFEKESFSSRFGYEVTDVLVGWDNNPDVDHYPPFGKFPPGVWVNAKNPVPAISMEQLAGILLAGSP